MIGLHELRHVAVKLGPARTLLLLPLLVGVGVLSACGGSKSSAATAVPFDHLVIGRSQRLTVRQANGQEQTLLEAPPGSFPASPAWSPDGTKIAFVQSVPFQGDTTADWGGDIAILPAAGGTPQVVRKHTQPGDEVYGLAWTPDGQSLLFGHHVTTFKNGQYASATQEIDRLDLATGKESELLANGVYPSLSRDGSKLAYLTQDPNTGQGGVWVASGDGQNGRLLVPLGERFPGILYPHISPDGTTVAFSAPPGTTQPSGRSVTPASPLRWLLAALQPGKVEAHGLPMDVWRVSVADGTMQQLTHLNADDPDPTWSGDGRMIAFIATGGLYTVDVDGGDLRRVGQGEFNGNVDARWAGSR